MTDKRLIRMGAGVAGASLLLSVAPATAWAAPRPKVGPVHDLTLTATAPAAGYALDADWTTLAPATRYAVRLTDGAGTLLSSASVTDSDWSGTATRPAGEEVTVTVIPYAGNRRGRAASTSTTLPDVTAPHASYSVLRNPANPTDGNVTLRQESLSDDLSTPEAVTRVVDWGDGTSAESWTTGTELSHAYPGTKAVYYPTVTLTDEAGNPRVVPLTVAVADTLAPTGSFTASPGNGFAAWTPVVLEQTALEDDLSSPEHVTRTVDWGDGSAPEVWQSGAPASHVYAAGGTFEPTVTLTDEAGNPSAPIGTTPVTVEVDSTAPVLSLLLPRVRSTRLASWTRIRGTVVDGDGVGVRSVSVKVVEKRRTAWFAYEPATTTWVKAGRTKASAMRRAGTAVLTTNTYDRWVLQVHGLRKGLLVYKARGIDNVGNLSAWMSHQQRITRG